MFYLNVLLRIYLGLFFFYSWVIFNSSKVEVNITNFGFDFILLTTVHLSAHFGQADFHVRQTHFPWNKIEMKI